MRRKLLLAAIPLGLALPFMIGGRWGAKAPIQADNHASVEQTLGYHLVAPTYLPRGMVAGSSGVRIGTARVLCNYGTDADTLIVAQEKRNPKRDAYNHARFTGRSVDVNGNEGHITTGKLGERQVTFFTPDLTVVLSSATLSEPELIQVARSME
jgi:hypothetical protein